MSFFKLQPEALCLFLQADKLVAVTPVALLILHQLLLQFFHLGGVGRCERRELLIQKFVFLVLQPTSQKEENKTISKMDACTDALQKRPSKILEHGG